MHKAMARKISRRVLLKKAAVGLGVLATSGMMVARNATPATKTADPQLAEFEKAGIDWQQLNGEVITVGIIASNFFDVARELTPLFTQLTGIRVNYQILPPLQLREKHIMDLSTKAGQWASGATDLLYYPMYASNGWIEDLGPYISDQKLTNKEWLDLPDIIPAWLESNSFGGKQYGLPYDGGCSIHVRRADVYKSKGIAVPETLDDLMETAKKSHNPANNLFGIVLRGFAGTGMNMYIFPTIFRSFGGQWFDSNGNSAVNSKEGVDALSYYVELLTNYGPPGVVNWNWQEELDAFINGTVVQFLDESSIMAPISNPAKSKVVGKVAFGRWPKGRIGKRVGSIWNWSFCISKAIPDRAKKATWLWMQWMASKPLQAATSYAYTGKIDKRTGVNRVSLWQNEQYRKAVEIGPGFADAVLGSLREDSDPNFRPRIPQWPKFGNIMATAVQKALAKQMTPKQALDEAQTLIVQEGIKV